MCFPAMPGRYSNQLQQRIDGSGIIIEPCTRKALPLRHDDVMRCHYHIILNGSYKLQNRRVSEQVIINIIHQRNRKGGAGNMSLFDWSLFCLSYYSVVNQSAELTPTQIDKAHYFVYKTTIAILE